MPKLVVREQGKGNGIHTNIINLYDVAKALKVPTSYPIRFMGYDKGSHVNYKEKGNDIISTI